jgi:hypothetical protein
VSQRLAANGRTSGGVTTSGIHSNANLTNGNYPNLTNNRAAATKTGPRTNTAVPRTNGSGNGFDWQRLGLAWHSLSAT